ncbi:hypothetical protein M434DRAFT_35220 [Hypoxylon sp. CO27-5]|nr:hypothetical protein M434DRAFT_35220 [Hypoxylon sp. CO27-5]
MPLWVLRVLNIWPWNKVRQIMIISVNHFGVVIAILRGYLVAKAEENGAGKAYRWNLRMRTFMVRERVRFTGRRVTRKERDAELCSSCCNDQCIESEADKDASTYTST